MSSKRGEEDKRTRRGERRNAEVHFRSKTERDVKLLWMPSGGSFQHFPSFAAFRKLELQL